MSKDPDAVWKALGDPTRRNILDRLSENPRTTGDLVTVFPDLCRTAVMKHLDVLQNANLIIVKREGRLRWNHLNPVPIQEICDRWVSRHVRHLASAASRLKAVAESPTKNRAKKKGLPRDNQN